MDMGEKEPSTCIKYGRIFTQCCHLNRHICECTWNISTFTAIGVGKGLLIKQISTSI